MEDTLNTTVTLAAVVGCSVANVPSVVPAIVSIILPPALRFAPRDSNARES